MGIELMKEIFDDAPETLSWRERYILTVIAENANDKTRQGWPGYDGDTASSVEFRRRCRCSRTQFYEVLDSLVKHGVLVIEVSGRRRRRARYSIPPLATAVPLPGSPVRARRGAPKRNENTPDNSKNSVPSDGTQTESVPSDGTQSDSVPSDGTLSEPEETDAIPVEGGKCPATGDSEASIVSRTAEKSVPSNGTPSPQVPSKYFPLKEQNLLPAPSADGSGPEDTTAAAGASAGDGLRPRGFAAPEILGQDTVDAPAETASDDPGADRSSRSDLNGSLVAAVVDALSPLEAENLLVRLRQADLAAVRAARGQAVGATPAEMNRSHLRHLFSSKPLAVWPQEILPTELRRPSGGANAPANLPALQQDPILQPSGADHA